MDAYPITEDIYRIPGGFGSNGENYGGILIANSPPILIGASGSNKFVTNLLEALNNLNLNGNLKIFYPCLLWEEIKTAEMIQKQLPSAEFHVHEDLFEMFTKPKANFLGNRFHAHPQGEITNLGKKLPNNIGNVFKVNKLTNIETDKTKILIIPSPGPHKGHIFVYSRDHKMLCTGLILGLTPSNSKLYYIDKTGSLDAYKEALKFLDQANAEIVVPIYDEPYYTTHSPISTIEISSLLETADDTIVSMVTSQPQSFKNLYNSFVATYAEKYTTAPYGILQFNATIFFMHIERLVERKLLIKENDQYRRN